MDVRMKKTFFFIFLFHPKTTFRIHRLLAVSANFAPIVSRPDFDL